MAGSKGKLGLKKDEAILALLKHRNVEEAARAIGIGTRTLFRWLTEPEFEAAYRKAKRDAYRQAIGRLQQGSATAVSVLLKIMVDSAEPASARVRAGEIILNHAARAIEIEEIEARVSALEEVTEISKPGGQDGSRR
jgi:hypothetical protein